MPDEAALRALHERRYGPDGRSLEVSVVRLRPPSPRPVVGESAAEREARVRAARAAVESRLEALAARVRAGEDVAALARAESEDPESAGRGGALPAPQPTVRIAPITHPNRIVLRIAVLMSVHRPPRVAK